MSGVEVIGYRTLIEPPELGDCADPECRTVAVMSLRAANAPELAAIRGMGVLLVASYSSSDRSAWLRVCTACDERHLRAWLVAP